ncbi:LANO_0C02630g1_1 [Lachancea nothofagi CBS 11611]|uniref:LANO_0C02630g1_1 n=1 Tax=Lachancea nothofagi CBS 11611 TaxID=1266666 RepID=A0A1G4J5C7_9SACH|nr:LANO_0C02630g1_1 [Lachancea nothofagi CBS 11611]
MELLRLSYGIDKLENLVDERCRLVLNLQMNPSTNDTINVKKQLNATLESLKEMEENISRADESQFDGLADKYNGIIAKIPDKAVEKNLYTYIKEAKPQKASETSPVESKRVRFKDDILEFQELAGESENAFLPYTDETPQQDQDRARLFESNDYPDSQRPVIAPRLSNQELFVQQQQQLLEQDSHLEELSQSVHRGHDLSLDINHEMTNQNDNVLRDLESLVDNSGRNLDRAKKRLHVYEKTARENGPCLIIVLLVLILVLLLIAL